jgi:hypothetical protein
MDYHQLVKWAKGCLRQPPPSICSTPNGESINNTKYMIYLVNKRYGNVGINALGGRSP